MSLKQVRNTISERSRAKKLDHFYSLCSSDSLVLDVGVSSNEHSDSVNFFLKNFRFPANQYLGLAVQPMDEIRTIYPDKEFVEYDGNEFPFETNEFDWVFSNAVVEHVGDRKKQLMFINEMLRVGKRVFFTTPNKWFPVESHTNALFRHWFDESFYQWCQVNEPTWNRDNLLLLDKGNLHKLMQVSSAGHYHISTNRMLGWPMTFTVVGLADNDDDQGYNVTAIGSIAQPV